MQLINTLYFATYIVQSPPFLNPKFQASGHRHMLYSPVVSNLNLNPQDRFSHDEAHMQCKTIDFKLFHRETHIKHECLIRRIIIIPLTVLNDHDMEGLVIIMQGRQLQP